MYQTVIEAVGGDDRVKANFLPTVLTGAARSCLINLPEGSITPFMSSTTSFGVWTLLSFYLFFDARKRTRRRGF
jgi:hypothetical protein